MLIPEPSLSLSGISSIWRPFQTMVGIRACIKPRSVLIYLFSSLEIWMALVVSLVFTMAMSIFEWFLEGRNDHRGQIELHWLFLFGLLVSKGNLEQKNNIYNDPKSNIEISQPDIEHQENLK